MKNEDTLKGYELITQTLLAPKEINNHGSIFGGYIFSLMDVAAYMICRNRFSDYEFVTRQASTDFTSPLFPGDIVTLMGKTSHRRGSSAVGVDLVAVVEKAKHFQVAVRTKGIMVAVRKTGKGFKKCSVLDRYKQKTR